MLPLVLIACGGASSPSSVTMPALHITSPLDPLSGELRFAQNAVDPLARDAARFDDIARALADRRLTLVVVSGHAGPEETPAVADGRAQRVVAMLVARGIDGARLVTRAPVDVAPRPRARCGNGEADADEDAYDDAVNRWVRFTVARTTED
jgi:hypothetical protein